MKIVFKATRLEQCFSGVLVIVMLVSIFDHLFGPGSSCIPVKERPKRPQALTLPLLLWVVKMK